MGTDQRLAGDWVGSIAIDSQWWFAHVHIDVDDQQTSATLMLPLDGVTPQPLTQIALAPYLHFEWRHDLLHYTFDGRWADSTMDGVVQHGDARGTFQLLHVIPLDHAQYEPLVGLYQLAPNHFISITNLRDVLGWDQLMYGDFSSARFGALFPIAATTFVTGPTILAPLPMMATITFLTGTSTATPQLNWCPTGAVPRTASALPLRHEPIRFRSGEVTLAGTLTLPLSEGPHPAVVMIGYEPRAIYLDLTHMFAAHGIAVLRYDRRGDGESTGDWQQATFETLADDAIASVHFLQQHRAIRPTQIGLWGLSQTGWIAPLAAARSTDVAFIITISGPGVSPARQELYSVSGRLRADGFAEEAIGEAVAYQQLLYDVLRTGAGWDVLESRVQQASQAPWAAYVGLPASRDDLDDLIGWRWFRQVMDYDPAPVIARVTCPALVLFGALDPVVPVAESVQIWEHALRQSGNTDHTITVLPTANHGLWAATSGSPREWPHLTGHVPGYYQTIVNWLLQRVAVAL
jgi:pimeloyl-ACP methyl ester carboxylesterase